MAPASATDSRLVARGDIVDYATYNDQRTELRPGLLAAKQLRRIHLHDCLTFLFENRATLQYQIQEIMRVEQIVREADIVHEIDTYNSILGGPGDLGCVLLIEIENESVRKERLANWIELPSHLYVKLPDGHKVYASFDAAQVGSDRLSAVQYLQFAVAGTAPIAIGADFEGLESEVQLTAEQVAALTQDLTQL